jgi:phosphoribosylformylglycinamidine cyclo-ligase
MKQHVSRTHSAAVLTGLGSFGSVFSLTEAIRGMADPLMAKH